MWEAEFSFIKVASLWAAKEVPGQVFITLKTLEGA